MNKNRGYILLVSILIGLASILFSSCCSPINCKVTVNYIGADTRLGLTNFVEIVSFDDSYDLTFQIPEGYDHQAISVRVDDRDWEYDVDYLQDADVGYEYSIEKNINIHVTNIRKNFKIAVNLSNMKKLKFNINLDETLEDFKIVTVADESLKRLTELNSENILKEIELVNNSASIEYGENILFVNSSKNKSYSAIYSTINHFTDSKKIANLGTLEFSMYSKSIRGNTNYNYNSQTNTSIYYFGKVQEDVKFYSDIPNYEESKGFVTSKSPNVFYLFTNLSEYNGQMLNIQPYYQTNASYDSTNINQDYVDGVTITKADPSYIYKDRYDVHQIYLGEDFENDTLMSLDVKNQVHENVYIQISSEFPVSELKISLINYEYENSKNPYFLQANIVSSKDKYYIKLTREDMLQFSFLRDTIIDEQVYEYYTGSAILSVSAKDYILVNDTHTGNYDYTSIYLTKYMTETDKDFTDLDTFHVMVYLKNGDERIYGFVDYQVEANRTSGWRDVAYFKTSDLFDDGTYKNNLYIEVRGSEYSDFMSVTLDQVFFYERGYIINNTGAIKCENYKVYNGLEYILRLPENRIGYSFDIWSEININDVVVSMQQLNFVNLDLPIYSVSEGIYLTNTYLFNTRDDFKFVYYYNQDTFNEINISNKNDVYYFTRIDNDKNFDIELRLDPTNPNTVVSTSKPMYDIVGERMTIEVNGEPYYINVIKLNEIFETNTDKVLYVVKA